MSSKFKTVLWLASMVIILDHLTKYLIVLYVPQGTEFAVLPGFFDIVHTRNTGAAFGILSGWASPFRNVFFYVIGIFAFIFLGYYVRSTPATDRCSLVALGLVAGGALGNLTDRWWRGSVVDFLSVHYYNEVLRLHLFGKSIVLPLTWPAFNVADAAICVGVGLLIIQSLRTQPSTTSRP